MYYIKKDLPEPNAVIILTEIEKIIGKKSIHLGYTDGKLRELEIDDKGLSPTKKTQLQIYIDTLKD